MTDSPINTLTLWGLFTKSREGKIKSQCCREINFTLSSFSDTTHSVDGGFKQLFFKENCIIYSQPKVLPPSFYQHFLHHFRDWNQNGTLPNRAQAEKYRITVGSKFFLTQSKTESLGFLYITYTVVNGDGHF